MRGVIVDFTAWDSGALNANLLTLTVAALRRYGTIAESVSAPQSWTEPVASSTTSGITERVHLAFGDQGHGGGFQLRFTAVRGVAIRAITVEGDVTERRT